MSNKLMSIKDLLFKNVINDIPKICECLTTDSVSPDNLHNLRHPGRYTVESGFTVARLMMITVIAEMAEYDTEQVLDKISDAVWEKLTNWFFIYSENNMYQAQFYRIFFLAVRSNHEKTLGEVLKKNKFIASCINAFDEEKGKGKFYNKGAIVKCCNALRLQIQTLSPSAFLRNFLFSHDAWKAFQPELRKITEANRVEGMGVPLPSDGIDDYATPRDEGEEAKGIDIGSTFAREMGFGDEIAWPEEEGKKKKKKKKKRKKKKKNEEGAEGSGSSASEESEGDGDEDAEEEEDEEEE